jgi:cytochrome c551/c552
MPKLSMLLTGSLFRRLRRYHPVHAAVDAAAAQALAKKNDCFKCHAPDKTKKGPSYKKIAAKYKEKKLTEKDAIKQMTMAPRSSSKTAPRKSTRSSTPRIRKS